MNTESKSKPIVGYDSDYDSSSEESATMNNSNSTGSSIYTSIYTSRDAEADKNIYNDIDMEKNADGTYVFDPYNAENKEITVADVESILSRYGVPAKVFNIELYKRAFVHHSYTKRPQSMNLRNNIAIAEMPEGAMPLRTKSNERLEFVGDGVLECITKYYLYRRFPKENEGFMTEKKIAIVKNESIGKIALEMGLHKWFVISRHAEEMKTRTNIKRLGCLFEAFIGAMFLDYNKIAVADEDGWFRNVFVCGPGFQMAQIFVENVFERHVDWIKLIRHDDNYKNIFQVKIQKEFKTTPEYIELGFDADTGYHMGVFLCIGQAIHDVQPCSAIPFSKLGSFAAIQRLYEETGKAFVMFAESSHKIKKKAEQTACEIAIKAIFTE